jgi:hypothetical protein
LESKKMRVRSLPLALAAIACLVATGAVIAQNP